MQFCSYFTFVTVLSMFYYFFSHARQELVKIDDPSSIYFVSQEAMLIKDIASVKDTAEQGDPDAQCKIAKLYKDLSIDYWMQQKFEHAETAEECSKQYYISAVNQNSPRAQYEFSVLLAADESVEHHNGNWCVVGPKIKEYLIHSADQGFRPAENYLGCVYGEEGNVNQAEHYLYRAIAHGSPTAMHNMGCLYCRLGQPEKAREWFDKAKYGNIYECELLNEECEEACTEGSFCWLQEPIS